MGDIWFTSDTHFGHKNIIGFSERPFQHVTQMEEGLVAAWNNVVKNDDTVYHLGDFAMKINNNQADRISWRLNGMKHLIWGNHDKCYEPKGFLICDIYMRLSELNPPINLFHYPIESWHGMGQGAWHLHGHSHGKSRKVHNRLDVGVDCHNYRPINLDEVREIMNAQKPDI